MTRNPPPIFLHEIGEPFQHNYTSQMPNSGGKKKLGEDMTHVE